MSLVACSIKGYDAFSLRVFTVGLHLNETIELCRSNGCFTAIEEVSLWNLLDLLHVQYVLFYVLLYMDPSKNSYLSSI